MVLLCRLVYIENNSDNTCGLSCPAAITQELRTSGPELLGGLHQAYCDVLSEH
jgi:hypothetical protein